MEIEAFQLTYGSYVSHGIFCICWGHTLVLDEKQAKLLLIHWKSWHFIRASGLVWFMNESYFESNIFIESLDQVHKTSLNDLFMNEIQFSSSAHWLTYWRVRLSVNNFIFSLFLTQSNHRDSEGLYNAISYTDRFTILLWCFHIAFLKEESSNLGWTVPLTAHRVLWEIMW